MGSHYFLSYSRADAVEIADRLMAELAREAGDIARVWRDRDDLHSPAAWDSSIEQAIRECHAVLFVMTPVATEAREPEANSRS